MKTTIFLALNSRGLVKATKGKSSLRRDEIGITLKLEVPDSSFRAPYITAALSVPEHAITFPEIVVEAESDAPNAGDSQ